MKINKGLIIGVLVFLLVYSIDFVLIPWCLITVLEWFGLDLTMWQGIALVILFNVMTYKLRVKE